MLFVGYLVEEARGTQNKLVNHSDEKTIVLTCDDT